MYSVILASETSPESFNYAYTSDSGQPACRTGRAGMTEHRANT